MAIKFAVASTTVHWRGEHVTLVLDQPWHDTDPLVIDRPDLFKDEPTNVSQTSGYSRSTTDTASDPQPVITEEPDLVITEPVVEQLPPSKIRRRTR